MKKIFSFLLLVSVLLACSDFFPEKVIVKENGGVTRENLPEKPILDERACDFGTVEGDQTQNFAWNLATRSICPKVREFRYSVTMLRSAARQFCVDPNNARVQKDLEYNFTAALNAFEYLIANPMEPLRAGSSRLTMEIYSWPNYNRFALNAELIKAAAQDEAYAMRLAPSRKGLSAIERLIYNKQIQRNRFFTIFLARSY